MSQDCGMVLFFQIGSKGKGQVLSVTQLSLLVVENSFVEVAYASWLLAISAQCIWDRRFKVFSYKLHLMTGGETGHKSREHRSHPGRGGCISRGGRSEQVYPRKRSGMDPHHRSCSPNPQNWSGLGPAKTATVSHEVETHLCSWSLWARNLTVPLILLGGSQFPGPDTAKMQHFPGEEAGAAPAYSALGEQLKIRRTHVFTNCALKLIFLIVTPTEMLLTDALKLSCTLLDLHHVLCVCAHMRTRAKEPGGCMPHYSLSWSVKELRLDIGSRLLAVVCSGVHMSPCLGGSAGPLSLLCVVAKISYLLF